MFDVQILGYSSVRSVETLHKFTGLHDNHRLVTIAKRNCRNEREPSLFPMMMTVSLLVNLGETERERSRLRECGEWLAGTTKDEVRHFGIEFAKNA